MISEKFCLVSPKYKKILYIEKFMEIAEHSDKDTLWLDLSYGRVKSRGLVTNETLAAAMLDMFLYFSTESSEFLIKEWMYPSNILTGNFFPWRQILSWYTECKDDKNLSVVVAKDIYSILSKGLDRYGKHIMIEPWENKTIFEDIVVGS